jgi:hypothetical protein
MARLLWSVLFMAVLLSLGCSGGKTQHDVGTSVAGSAQNVAPPSLPPFSPPHR